MMVVYYQTESVFAEKMSSPPGTCSGLRSEGENKKKKRSTRGNKTQKGTDLGEGLCARTIREWPSNLRHLLQPFRKALSQTNPREKVILYGLGNAGLEKKGGHPPKKRGDRHVKEKGGLSGESW